MKPPIKSIFSNCFAVKVTYLFLFIFGCLLFFSCDQEEYFEQPSIQRNDLIELANKYGIQVTINNSVRDCYKAASLDELEEIFKSIKNHQEQSIRRNLYKCRVNNQVIFKTGDKNFLRLKNGNPENRNIHGESEWFFNLTWLNASVGYHPNTRSAHVTSSFSGISLWNYTQDQSAYYYRGDTLHYQFTGTATMGISIGGFGIHSRSRVNAHGWIAPSSGGGELIIDTSGYWY